MKKVVILGCENSHADAFLNLIYNTDNFSGIEIIGVYSDEVETAERLHEKYGVPVMQAYDEFVGKVDGVIVTARHGGNHYKYAKPYIKSGVPMFIDKPITVTEEDAAAFMAELENTGVCVCGGSCCKYDPFVQELKRTVQSEEKTAGGFVRAPISRKNAYGDFYFYTQHLVEVLLEIFGYAPKTVLAVENEVGVSMIFRFENFDVNGLYVDKNGVYYASWQGEKEVKSGNYLTDFAYCTQKEFEEYYRLLNGGEQAISYQDFFKPVFVLNAIERAINSGKEEKIHG